MRYFEKQALGTKELYKYMQGTGFFANTVKSLGKQLNRGSKEARRQTRDLGHKIVKFDLARENAAKTLRSLKRKGML